MMQVIPRYDTLADATEAHETLALEVCADGIVTPGERTQLAASARRLRLMAYRQSIRIKLGTRILRGGEVDRRLLGEIKDYQSLVAQEKATPLFKNEAA